MSWENLSSEVAELFSDLRVSVENCLDAGLSVRETWSSKRAAGLEDAVEDAARDRHYRKTPKGRATYKRRLRRKAAERAPVIQQRRQERAELVALATSLISTGMSRREVAKQLNVGHSTVNRWLKAS